MTDQSETAIDRNDKNWYRALALAGITLAVTSANAAMEPAVFEILIAGGMAAVFLMLVKLVSPEVPANA